MDIQTILSVAIASLLVFVVAHFAVFWVVKTMYPPRETAHVTFMEPIVAPPAEVFTPPATDIQHVDVPTYEAPVPAKTPNKEGESESERRGPPPPESTSIRGESGVAAPNAQ